MSRANAYPSCVCGTVTAKPDGKCAECGGYWQIPRTTESLTIREHFAAMAMQGLVARYTLNKPEDFGIVAQAAVRQANALIAELAK